jgi:hypothetical protein
MWANVIKAPAGLGKTHVFASQVANATGIVEVYAPTHRLALHWRDQILGFNPNKDIQVFQGRSFPIRHQIRGSKKARISHLCMRTKAADALTSMGLPVYPNLCKRSKGPGVPPDKCQHYDHCSYINQFRRAAVYLYTHAHLSLARTALETWQPSTVIIDESCFQTLIDRSQIQISLLTHTSLPSAARSLCADLAKAFGSGGSMAPRLTIAAAGGELKDALDSLRVLPALSPSTSDLKQQSVLNQFVNFEPIRQLLIQLAAESTIRLMPQSAVFDQTTGLITLHRRKSITRFDRPDGTQPDVYLLDASASEAIVSRFFDIKPINPMQVRRNAHVIQCLSTRCATSSLVPARNADLRSKADATRRLAELERLIERLAANQTSVLVVGPSAVVGNANLGTAPLISIPAHCELAHFNSLRGIDRWKFFETVLVIGRNEPPVQAVEDMARALYFDDPIPLNLTGSWVQEVRGYRMVGESYGVDTMVHADERIQDVLEQLRENETLQAIDRLRLLHNPTKRTVVLLSNLPLDIDVDEVRTWDELMNGTRLERAWDAHPGVLPLEPTWLSSNHPALWRTAEAAKQDVRKARKKGGFSNMFSIRKKTLFEFTYKHRGQRRASTCLAESPDPEEVTNALQALVGTGVKAKLKRQIT